MTHVDRPRKYDNESPPRFEVYRNEYSRRRKVSFHP